MPTKPTPDAPPVLSRDQFLTGGKLEEDIVNTPIGPVLVRELTGEERAELMNNQVGRGKANMIVWRRQLILLGVKDPASPEDDRQPLFEEADMDIVMSKGSATIEAIVDRIEELSGLTSDSKAAAEKN